MARFACPTGSTYSFINQDSTCPLKTRPSAPPPVKSKRETSSKKRDEKLASAKEAKKKAKVKKNVWPAAYVGNLLPGVTVQELSNLFATQCGRPAQIDIRCSYGDATIPSRVGSSSGTSNLPGRRYASIIWKDHTSYKKALGLDGATLQGVPIIVTLSVGDLPEVKDLVIGRIQERKMQFMPPDRSLAGEPTVIIPPSPHKERKACLGQNKFIPQGDRLQ